MSIDLTDEELAAAEVLINKLNSLIKDRNNTPEVGDVCFFSDSPDFDYKVVVGRLTNIRVDRDDDIYPYVCDDSTVYSHCKKASREEVLRYFSFYE